MGTGAIPKHPDFAIFCVPVCLVCALKDSCATCRGKVSAAKTLRISLFPGPRAGVSSPSE